MSLSSDKAEDAENIPPHPANLLHKGARVNNWRRIVKDSCPAKATVATGWVPVTPKAAVDVVRPYSRDTTKPRQLMELVVSSGTDDTSFHEADTSMFDKSMRSLEFDSPHAKLKMISRLSIGDKVIHVFWG